MVVGGKQGLCSQLFGAGGKFQHCPSNAHTVIGRGAPANLIQNQQAPGSGIFQNGGHLGHLHHKGGLAGGQVVAGADSCKHPVHQTDSGGPSRDKGAHLGHEHNQGHLAHIGGFARHIGACDNGNLVVLPAERGIIGHEQGILQHGLYHRVPSVGDGNFRSQADFRAAVAPLHRHSSQGAQRIRRRHRRGGLLNPGSLPGQLLPQGGKDLIFQSRQPVLGGEHLVFQLFQLLGDVALAVCKGLLADVICRHLVHKGLGNLNIVAEHPVKAHFQGSDACLFPFTGLNGRNGAGAAVHNIPEPVCIGVGTLADDAALPDGERRVVHNGFFNLVRTIRQRVNGRSKLLQQGAPQLCQDRFHLGQCPQPTGKGQQVPAVDSAGDDAGHDPLQVRHILEGLFQLAPGDGALHQSLYGGVPPGDLCRIQQRLFQPGAQHPPAHGRVGFVQYPQQGALFLLGAHGLCQLQVPPGIQIQLHKAAGGVVLQLPDVFQVIFLQGQQSLQQSPAGGQCCGEGGKAQLLHRAAEMAFQAGTGLFKIEILCLTLVHAAAQAAEEHIGDGLILYPLTKAQHLAGGEAAQFGSNGSGVGAGGGEERAGRQVAKGKAELAALAEDAAHVVILALLQHTAFGDGAGGDDAGNVPFHQSLGQGRVLHLLTDGNLIALLHQPRNIGVHAVVGHAAHGRLLLLGLAAVPAGQRQVQLPGCQLGILVEHFIEVTQAEKQNAVLIPGLHFLILPLHGSQFFFCHNCFLSANSPVRLHVVAPVMRRFS